MFQDASCGFLPLPLLLFHPRKSRLRLIKIDVWLLSNHISICCFSIFYNWNHEPDETSHINFLCVTQLDYRLTSVSTLCAPTLLDWTAGVICEFAVCLVRACVCVCVRLCPHVYMGIFYKQTFFFFCVYEKLEFYLMSSFVCNLLKQQRINGTGN